VHGKNNREQYAETRKLRRDSAELHVERKCAPGLRVTFSKAHER
jgi:hypothetical protein